MDVKIGTFNILHGRDYMHYLATGEEVIDLMKVSDAIKTMGLDICGLNEVRNQENVEGLCNQARVIAENIGYCYAFGKAINSKGGEYGNALISRYPIEDVEFIPITVPKETRTGNKYYEDRVLIAAKMSIDKQPLTVLVTHFGLNGDEQAEAIRVVKEYISKCTDPIVFMGDLNLCPASECYGQLSSVFKDTAETLTGEASTYPCPHPKYKIDYIFCNDRCRVTGAYVPEINVSDHRPYVTDIAIG